MSGELLELDEMQGLLLRGYGDLPHAAFLLYGVDEPAPARAWLGDAGRTAHDREATSRRTPR